MASATEIRRIRESISRVASELDADQMDDQAAVEMLKDVTTIEKVAGAIKTILSAQVAASGALERSGALSPAHGLARLSGTTVGRARELLATAERLEEQPGIASALRQGELSADQATVISEAVAFNPAAEAGLLAKARDASLQELRDECGRAKAAADRDADSRHQRIHAARLARRRTCPDGSSEVLYRSTPEEITEFWSVVMGYANRAFEKARRDGRYEPSEAYAADGLLAMARAAAGDTTSDRTRHRSPVPTRVVVRIDWDALVRGWPVDDETCQLAGVGSVPVSVVRSMLATGDPFLAAVVTKGRDVVNVAHLGRRPNVFQTTALDWMSPVCTAAGCDVTARHETDHRLDWSKTRITLLKWLDRYCGQHHDLKTYDGWALVEGTGKRPMVPPDDPRHPLYGTGMRPKPYPRRGPRKPDAA